MVMMGLTALSCGGGSPSTGRSTITDVGWVDGGMGGAPAAGDRASSAVGLSDASLARDGGSDPWAATSGAIDGGPSSLPDGGSPDVNPIRVLEHRISKVQ
jgi:hypothetical protein